MVNYEEFFEECRDSIKQRAEQCALALELAGLHSNGDISFESDGLTWAYVIDVKNHAEVPRISFSLQDFDVGCANSADEIDKNEGKFCARSEIVGFGGICLGEASGEWTDNKDIIKKDFASFTDGSIVGVLSGPKISLKNKI